MKYAFLILMTALIACTTEQQKQEDTTPVATYDSVTTPVAEEPHIHAKDTVDVFSNARFKNVYVEKLNDTSFRVNGKAQVFEAMLGWVVEDGHNELLEGHAMTDAGAPEFGNFSFVVNVKKKRPNSTLHIILFESSAKDGSRQHELPVPLETASRQ